LFICYILGAICYHYQITYYPTAHQKEQLALDAEEASCNKTFIGGWNMHTHKCLNEQEWEDQIGGASDSCEKKGNDYTYNTNTQDCDLDP
jgi:hypothetical protein